MILPDFVLPSRVNQSWEYTGIDSLDQCLDKKHFKSYPHKVSYNYNSRGFRDLEWPADLIQSVWCIGDSFTVGLGSPIEHTWPYQLAEQLQCRTINVSMDGASNQWMARKAIDIIKQVAPKVIVIQWSYLHRNELNDSNLPDESRRLFVDCIQKDISNTELGYTFINLIQQVESAKQHTRIVHSFIPDFGIENNITHIWSQIAGPGWPSCPVTLVEFENLDQTIINELNNNFRLYNTFKIYFELYNNVTFVPEITRLDLARDGHHYDILTAQQFARSVRQLLNRAG